MRFLVLLSAALAALEAERVKPRLLRTPDTQHVRKEAHEAPWRAAHEAKAFSALQLEASTKNAPLYSANVGFDYKTLNKAGGVTVTFDPKSYALKVMPGVDKSSGLAWGYLEEKLGTTGWDELYLQTSPSARATNDVRMYAAGFIEGFLTAERLSQFYSNFYQLIQKNEDNMNALTNIKTMYQKEIDFAKTNANLHPGALSVEPMDPYWKHVRYNLFQLWGMKDGYNAIALPGGVRMLDLVDMWLINSHGELAEEMQAYTPAAMEERRKAQGAFLQVSKVVAAARKMESSLYNINKDPDSMLAKDVAEDPTDQAWEQRMQKSRCSAFVRVADQNSDILVGHTTWDDYSKMTRIFKYYNFHLPGAWTKTTHMGFSSYPGCLSSTDNFYILDSGLVVVDTTLEILNPKLYDRVPDFPSNSKIPNFLHLMSVNRMATTGVHWTTLFSERNTGLGNAQWMVVDYNLFSVGTPIPDNTVWMVEQIPGLTQKTDLSNTLRNQGYFASYNRPYFSDTRKETGHSAAEAKHGPLYSFAGNPRAQIFSRVGGSVETLFDVRNLMTRNNYPNEGTAPSAPGHAISARMDLVGYSPIPNGGIDAKVVNRCLLRQLQAQAISGPTHAQQKVFAWREEGKDLWPGWPHMGLPDVYNFDWVQMTPTGAMAISDVAC